MFLWNSEAGVSKNSTSSLKMSLEGDRDKNSIGAVDTNSQKYIICVLKRYNN